MLSVKCRAPSVSIGKGGGVQPTTENNPIIVNMERTVALIEIARGEGVRMSTLEKNSIYAGISRLMDYGSMQSYRKYVK